MGVVRRYIDILTIIFNFPDSICISSFLAAASLLLCSFYKCFFVLVRIRIRRRNGDFLLRATLNCTILAMFYTHSIGNQL